MGAIGLVFSWYANPLFLFACLKLLLTNRSAGFTAGLAVVLAISMLFYSEIPGTNGYIKVYGYGWGAYLWCSAILLAPVAARARQIEQRQQHRGVPALWRDAPGIFWLMLLVAWAGGSFSFGSYQKFIASKTERERLCGATSVAPSVNICNNTDSRCRQPPREVIHVGQYVCCRVRGNPAALQCAGSGAAAFCFASMTHTGYGWVNGGCPDDEVH